MPDIFDGFEGFRTIDDDQLEHHVLNGTVVLDANVLLSLYGLDETARNSALEFIASVQERLFIPHQVMREFWRNRPRAIYDARSKSLPLDDAKQQLSQILNGLNPDKTKSAEIEEIKAKIDQTFTEVAQLVNDARGTPLDVDAALASTSRDPVLAALTSLLEDRVGERADDETDLVQGGLKRFEREIPPGYEDAQKSSQTEQGTGDYLLWEQSLRQMEATGGEHLVIVSADSKSDWRIRHPSGSGSIGVRPELVNEAMSRGCQSFALLAPAEFYRIVGKAKNFDSEQTEFLVAATDTPESESESVRWSEGAFTRLLRMLEDQGFADQAAVIVAAARGNGVIARAEIFEVCGFSPSRSLVRFALPAQRMAAELVERGILGPEANTALEAMYEGPGKATAYRVPFEFVEYQQRAESNVGQTWLEDAETVMRSEPNRFWTPSELVEEIGRRKLRDLSRARTPEKTLRRDLAYRGGGTFIREGDRYGLRP